ncbi:hypothetical protein R1flu_015822 [Riccia fluitans]|uniref:Uncharacterized protein n=1 Tax=Riccia fluitans TaxID=41844 RepID=A0ABD1YK33_9MARC
MSHSPNLDKLDQEASMPNIDRFIEALEMEAKESRMSKRRKLFLDEASSSALDVYQPLDREEPSTLTVKPTRSNIGTTSECIMDLSAASLRKLVDFPKGECHMIVPPFEVEAEFLKQTSFARWEAIVRIVTADFLAKQAIARHEPLLLEAPNAFTNTRVEWDNEKGELVHEREALKEELNKAKEMAVEAKQCTEVVRLEKEALQQQYTKDKVEWETKNT